MLRGVLGCVLSGVLSSVLGCAGMCLVVCWGLCWGVLMCKLQLHCGSAQHTAGDESAATFLHFMASSLITLHHVLHVPVLLMQQDFNPKAERTRFVTRNTGGGGGFATARTKSKGPSGARAAGGWPQPPARAAVAPRQGSNRAAAAQKAAQRATQNAHAQRMHPHMMPARAGGGHMSTVVPTHRCVERDNGCAGVGVAFTLSVVALLKLPSAAS
jgi:hypothetical protein